MAKDLKLLEIDSSKVCMVTGACGFIGFHLSMKLLNMGLEVIGVDNLNNYYDVKLKQDRLSILNNFKNFVFYKVDIADKDGLDEIFRKHKIDYVVNLAAQAGVRYSIDNPGAYIHSNINGFFNILEMVRKYKPQHLIFASSSSVYGANKKIPFSTDDKVDKPVSLYAATKASNELMAYCYCKLFNIYATGLRFFTVYGSYGRPDMAYFKFTKSIIEEKPIQIYNNGDLYRDFSYIDDIINGIIRVIPNVPKEDEIGVHYKVYNIGNHNPVNLMKFVEIIEKEIGKKAIKEFLPMQPGDVYTTYADVTDLIDDLGYNPNTPVEEGIKRFVDWYKEYYSIK